MNDQTQTVDQTPPPAYVPALPPKPKAELVAQAAGVLPILPTTIEEAQRYASGLIQAGIVPDAFKHSKDVLGPPGSTEPIARQGEINAPLVLMGVLKSMELGVAPQTGLAGLLPLNGRFSVWGDLAIGLAQRAGVIEKQTVAKTGSAFEPSLPMGEWPDDYGYVVSYWRTGQAEPYVGRFTIRDAKRAGLWMNSRKQPWIMYPDRMLFNRARAFALRDGFADALGGLSIAEEVMDALPDVEEQRAVETKRLTALTDDEPDTGPSDLAGHNPDGPITSEPRQEPPQDAAVEPEGPTTPPEPAIDAGEAPSQPSGDVSHETETTNKQEGLL